MFGRFMFFISGLGSLYQKSDLLHLLTCGIRVCAWTVCAVFGSIAPCLLFFSYDVQCSPRAQQCVQLDNSYRAIGFEQEYPRYATTVKQPVQDIRVHRFIFLLSNVLARTNGALAEIRLGAFQAMYPVTPSLSSPQLLSPRQREPLPALGRPLMQMRGALDRPRRPQLHWPPPAASPMLTLPLGLSPKHPHR